MQLNDQFKDMQFCKSFLLNKTETKKTTIKPRKIAFDGLAKSCCTHAMPFLAVLGQVYCKQLLSGSNAQHGHNTEAQLSVLQCNNAHAANRV